MNTPSFRLIIFDLDGTLIDSRGMGERRQRGAVAAWACPPLETVQGYVGDGVTKLVERILPEERRDAFDAARAESFLEFYTAHSLDHTTSIPGRPGDGGGAGAGTANSPSSRTSDDT